MSEAKHSGEYGPQSLERMGRSGYIHTPPAAGQTEHRCTGLAATWCPIHGDCSCERREDGEIRFSGLHGCPLHAVDSQHAVADPDECPHCNGTGKVPHFEAALSGRRSCDG